MFQQFLQPVADIDWGPLAQRLTRTKFGERGFFYSGPAAWNTLSSDLYGITDTSTFRKWLKNVLFDRAYNWLQLTIAGAPGRVV